MDKKSELASLLRNLADFIDNRTDDELRPLFQQAQRMLASKPKEKYPPKPKKIADAPHAEEIAKILATLPSREAGEEYLRKSVSNRASLERLARFLQLPVQRDDTVERLRAKIVERSIGSRLRSEAIQGLDKSSN